MERRSQRTSRSTATYLSVGVLALLAACQGDPLAALDETSVGEAPLGEDIDTHSRMSAVRASSSEPEIHAPIAEEIGTHSQIAIEVLTANGNFSDGATVHLLDGSGQSARRATTDADGFALFDNLPDGTYQFWASAPGLASTLQTASAGSDDAETNVHRVTLASASSLTARIQSQDGMGIEAEVTLVPRGHDHVVLKATSDLSGEFLISSVPHGNWDVHVRARDYAQPKLFRISAANPELNAKYVMSPKASLGGTVVDQSGAAISGARIRVTRVGQHPSSTMSIPSSGAGLKWVHPLTGPRAMPIRDTRRFGASRGGARPDECGNGHCGVDLGGVRGSPVLATASGTVVVASHDDRGASGRYVAIEHAAGLKSFYMHLDSVSETLELGATVAAGTLLGTLGRSGVRNSGPHLHFALSKEERERPYFFNPEPMLRFAVVLPTPIPSGERIVQRAASVVSFPPTEAAGTSRFDGSFPLRKLAAGTYVVSATHPDYAPSHSKKLVLRPGQSIASLRIPLNTGHRLAAKVFGPEGAVSDTWIRAYQGQGESRRRVARTGVDASGAFELPPLIGAVEVEIGAAGFGVIRRTLTAKEARAQDRVFELSRFDAHLRGQVRAPDGTPVSAAQVRIVSGPAGRGRRVLTNAFGFFDLPALPSGGYNLLIRAEGFPELAAHTKTGSEREFLLAMAGALRIDLRDDHSGAAVAGVRIRLRGPGKRATTGLTDAGGRLNLDSLLPGTWSFSIESADHTKTTQNVEISAGRDSAIREVRLVRGARLKGVLRDHFGERVGHAKVWVGSTETTTDDDGNFTLGQAPTGDVVLRAENEEARAALALDLDAGDELVTLELRLTEP